MPNLRSVLRGVLPRRLLSLPLDLLDRLRGRRAVLLPPRWLRLAGDGDFVTVGERLAGHCRELAGLRTNEDVLEIGCGPGRVARALAGYLGPSGTYCGFDVMRPAVRWCR